MRCSNAQDIVYDKRKPFIKCLWLGVVVMHIVRWYGKGVQGGPQRTKRINKGNIYIIMTAIDSIYKPLIDTEAA